MGSLISIRQWEILCDISVDYERECCSSSGRILQATFLHTEEVIGVKGDYPCDGSPLLLLDERS